MVRVRDRVRDPSPNPRDRVRDPSPNPSPSPNPNQVGVREITPNYRMKLIMHILALALMIGNGNP